MMTILFSVLFVVGLFMLVAYAAFALVISDLQRFPPAEERQRASQRAA
ncbi:MAG TPA: hypothetical protein VFS39_15250 [Nitrospira sp.]|nr:hypothetical protein [Nitrospira sp.]